MKTFVVWNDSPFFLLFIHRNISLSQLFFSEGSQQFIIPETSSNQFNRNKAFNYSDFPWNLPKGATLSFFSNIFIILFLLLCCCFCFFFVIYKLHFGYWITSFVNYFKFIYFYLCNIFFSSGTFHKKGSYLSSLFDDVTAWDYRSFRRNKFEAFFQWKNS